MDHKYYLQKFQQAADQLDKDLLGQHQLEVAVGVVLDSVYLKLYKKSWATALQDPLTAESRIFFSIWVNAQTVADQEILYNIHTFKLRHLKGYKISSIKFAEAFREGFKNFAQQWPNVSVAFGPLTLMEGRVKVDLKDFQEELTELSRYFFEIVPLVDDSLKKFKAL